MHKNTQVEECDNAQVNEKRFFHLDCFWGDGQPEWLEGQSDAPMIILVLIGPLVAYLSSNPVNGTHCAQAVSVSICDNDSVIYLFICWVRCLFCV